MNRVTDKNGFTLMELVIVVAILGILSVSTVTLFYRTLRSTNKTESLNETDKNAQMALMVIERTIRNARRVEAVGLGDCPGTSDSLTLLAGDGYEVNFNLENDRIASNGSSLTGSGVIIEELSFTCTRTEGVPDEITISFKATHTSTAEDATTEKTYTKVVSLRNFD